MAQDSHSLSYDALTANVAIVFTIYMLLATILLLHKSLFLVEILNFQDAKSILGMQNLSYLILSLHHE